MLFGSFTSTTPRSSAVSGEKIALIVLLIVINAPLVYFMWMGWKAMRWEDRRHGR